MTKLALSLITAGVLTLAVADTSAQTPVNEITTQIDQIQNATPQQRVEMMNQLKERIATMSPDERRATMQQLHLQMRSEAGNEHARDQQMMEKVEEMMAQMQEHRGEMGAHAQEMQQNAYREMEHNEHMNQREAGEQFKEQMQGRAGNPMGRSQQQNFGHNEPAAQRNPQQNYGRNEPTAGQSPQNEFQGQRPDNTQGQYHVENPAQSSGRENMQGPLGRRH